MLLVVAATEPELRGAEGVVCGVGPIDAAAATARAIVEHAPSAVLNVGIAGARRGTLDIGTVVIGSEARYCDTRSKLVAAVAEPDLGLVARAREALPGAQFLPIGTSADVGGTSGCEVEAMEGFGVLRAAALAGVPALEVRVVANEIEENDRAKWRFAEALDGLAALLPSLVAALDDA